MRLKLRPQTIIIENSAGMSMNALINGHQPDHHSGGLAIPQK